MADGTPRRVIHFNEWDPGQAASGVPFFATRVTDQAAYLAARRAACSTHNRCTAAPEDTVVAREKVPSVPGSIAVSANCQSITEPEFRRA